MRSNIILKAYDTELQGQHTNDGMNHLKNIQVIEQTISDNRLCLFYIKAPDCGVCNIMLDKVGQLADRFSSLCSFYTDIIEEPLIAGRFLVYSGPTVLLLMDGKEVYRGSQFIDLEELRYNINRYIELLDQ
jgi:thioredoxin-like negative regulator of GroEL